MDLTPQQIAILERLQKRGFEIVAFAMYANYIGVRKGNCAALLAPAASGGPATAGGFSLFGTPAYLIAGNFGVRVNRDGQEWFVWKKERIEATVARLAELEKFSAEVSDALLPTV
jgi:hypothetical protein